LATKPSRYKDLMLKAAELAKCDRRDALLALVTNTIFEPRGVDAHDPDRQPVAEVASILADLYRPLDAVFSLNIYFDILERFDLFCEEKEEGITFEAGLFSENRDVLNMPSTPFASRVVTRNNAALLVVGEPLDEKPDFQTLYEKGATVAITVDEIEHMSLAVCRING